jgi:CheY-like chemotaxis protein
MNGKRILVVDDDAGIVTILKGRLRSYGYEVRCAFDGASALEMVAEEVPDCVILDLEMPVMGGFEVLAQLKERHPTLPVLVLTASASKTTEQRVLEAGAVGYVLKPFDPETLRLQVERAVSLAETVKQGEP